MSTPAIGKLFAAMDASKGMPALEATVASIISAMLDRKKGSRDFAAHVIEDFALTQKVLKLANSAMYAPFANSASVTVTSAISILGADALLHIVLSTAMATEDEIAADKTLSRTLLAAEFARNVSAGQVEEASISTLMFDLGRMSAAKFLPEEYALLERHMASGATEDVASAEILGMTLQQLGTEVAKRWKLPREIVSIIDGSGDPVLVGIARFATSAAALMHEGKVDEVRELVSSFDLPGTDVSKLFSLIDTKAEKYPPIEVPVAFRKTESGLDELLAALTSEKRDTVEALAGAVFHAFGELLDTAHCLLFMATSSGDFTVRHGFGKGIDELRGKLRISREFKPTLFHAVIKNNVDVSISEVSKLRPAALPANYRMLLPEVRQFLILPVATSRVVGLFYCDWEIEKELSTDELLAVKKLRDLFLPYMPR